MVTLTYTTRILETKKWKEVDVADQKNCPDNFHPALSIIIFLSFILKRYFSVLW